MLAKSSKQETQWVVRPLEDGSGKYRLTNALLGRSFSLDSNNDAPKIAATNPYTGQFWTLTPLGSGWYRLTNDYLGGGNSLDTYKDSAGGIHVSLSQTGSYTGQFWQLTKNTSIATPSISADYMRLRNDSTKQYVNNNFGPLVASTVEAGWWSAHFIIAAVKGTTEKFFTIQSRWTGEYINITSGKLQLSTVQPTVTGAMWNFEPTPAGSFRITNRATNQSIDLQSGKLVLAAQSQPNQLTYSWSFEPYTATPVSPTTPNAPITSKGIHISATHSKKCVEIQNSAQENAAPLQQNDCNDQPNQLFVEKFLDGPWAMYVASHSGKCLEVAGGSKADLASIQQSDCDASKLSQQFRFNPIAANSDHYEIISRNSQSCIDISGASTNNGAHAIQYGCGPNFPANQVFLRSDPVAPPATDSLTSTLTFINTQVLGIQDPDPDTCWKNTYGRGVGTIPTTCPDDRSDKEGGLCYTQCKAGYTGKLTACAQNCPAGFTDDGVYSCYKPAPYVRSGYFWDWFWETEYDAKARCEAAEHVTCTPDLLHVAYYPNCRAGYYGVASSFVCSPVCPSGMSDTGATCLKALYDRGVGTIPECAASQQKDVGLCYDRCTAGSTGVGPVCWGSCNGDFPVNCGAACAKSSSACVFSIFDQVNSTIDLVLNVADLIATGGEAGPELKMAESQARNAGKRALTQEAKDLMTSQAKSAIQKAKSYMKPKDAREAVGNFMDTEEHVTSLAQMLVQGYQDGTFDWTAFLPSQPTAADIIGETRSHGRLLRHDGGSKGLQQAHLPVRCLCVTAFRLSLAINRTQNGEHSRSPFCVFHFAPLSLPRLSRRDETLLSLRCRSEGTAPVLLIT